MCLSQIFSIYIFNFIIKCFYFPFQQKEKRKKEIWENTDEKVDALKEETQKSLNELQENTTKQV